MSCIQTKTEAVRSVSILTRAPTHSIHHKKNKEQNFFLLISILRSHFKSLKFVHVPVRLGKNRWLTHRDPPCFITEGRLPLHHCVYELISVDSEPVSITRITCVTFVQQSRNMQGWDISLCCICLPLSPIFALPFVILCCSNRGSTTWKFSNDLHLGLKSSKKKQKNFILSMDALRTSCRDTRVDLMVKWHFRLFDFPWVLSPSDCKTSSPRSSPSFMKISNVPCTSGVLVLELPVRSCLRICMYSGTVFWNSVILLDSAPHCHTTHPELVRWRLSLSWWRCQRHPRPHGAMERNTLHLVFFQQLPLQRRVHLRPRNVGVDHVIFHVYIHMKKILLHVPVPVCTRWWVIQSIGLTGSRTWICSMSAKKNAMEKWKSVWRVRLRGERLSAISKRLLEHKAHHWHTEDTCAKSVRSFVRIRCERLVYTPEFSPWVRGLTKNPIQSTRNLHPLSCIVFSCTTKELADCDGELVIESFINSAPYDCLLQLDQGDCNFFYEDDSCGKFFLHFTSILFRVIFPR